MGSGHRLLCLMAGATIAIVVGMYFAGQDDSRPVAPVAEVAEFSLSSEAVPAIEPGTIIGAGAPKGWSHLVIKSQPTVGDDSIDKISSTLVGMASMLFTAIVADVRRDTPAAGGEATYRLSGVAAGVGTKVNGEDMVLSSDSYAKLGANLGLMGPTVLGGGETQLKQMRSVVRSRNMTILDSPTNYLIDRNHQAAVLRYAVLVDPKTGRLDTLVWAIKKAGDGKGFEVLGSAEWLPPNKLDECILHVDTSEFILGVPKASAFAVIRVPKGKAAVEMPGETKVLASASSWTEAEARKLEQQLRSILAKAS